MNTLAKKSFVFTISKSQKELWPLYFLFLAFALTAPFLYNSNILYAQNILALLLVYIFGIRQLRFRVFRNHVIGISAFVLFLILVQLLGYEISVYVLIFKLFVLFQFFNKHSFNNHDILTYLNTTYLFYLLLSYLAYFKIIDITLFSSVNSFEEGRFLFNIETLYGLEGTVAAIDSYSGFIVILNLMFRSKWRKSIIVIALFSLLLTTRLTPIVAGIGSLIYYYFIPIGLNYMVILIILTLFSLTIWLKDQPDSIKFFFAAISTNRTLIWTDQIQIFLEQLNPFSSIFSEFEGKYEIKVYSYEKITDNPHNSYLYIMFNSLAGFIFIILAFIKGVGEVKDKRFKTVIFFILIASLTNVHIIGLVNPSYIIFIIYSIVYFNQKRTNTPFLRFERKQK